MSRYQPHFIPLPEGEIDPVSGRIMRWDDGFVYPDERMQAYASRYMAGEDIGQLRYSRMISEYGEWLRRNPTWIDMNIRKYWTDESFSGFRLLDRHFHLIGAKRDVDDDIGFMEWAIRVDFRGYRTRKDAQAVHTKALAAISDDEIAESFGLPGTINSKASRHSGAAFLTLLSVMHDPNTKEASRVSAANAVLDRLAGKPQTFLAPLPIDITGLGYRDAVSAIMQCTLEGKISLESAKQMCELLVVREISKLDELEQRLTNLENKEAQDSVNVEQSAADIPWFPEKKEKLLHASE